MEKTYIKLTTLADVSDYVDSFFSSTKSINQRNRDKTWLQYEHRMFYNLITYCLVALNDDDSTLNNVQEMLYMGEYPCYLYEGVEEEDIDYSLKTALDYLFDALQTPGETTYLGEGNIGLYFVDDYFKERDEILKKYGMKGVNHLLDLLTERIDTYFNLY